MSIYLDINRIKYYDTFKHVIKLRNNYEMICIFTYQCISKNIND